MATLDQQKAYREAVARGDRSGAEKALSSAMTDSSDYAEAGTQAKANAVDPYAEIKRQQQALLEAQRQARINQLGQVRQSALASLGAEKETIQPAFRNQRTALDVSSQQQGRSMNDFLASRGLAQSGSAAQSEIARNVSTQQGLTDIGAKEAGAYADIARRQTAAEQAYQQGVAGAESEIAAQQAQTEINRLMQEQTSKESAIAKQAEMNFELQKAAQAFENSKTIENLRIAADDARAAKDFDREKELNKQRSDLEKEQIRLTASLKPAGGGGGGISASLQNTMLNQQVDEVLAGIASRTGDMTAEEYNAYVLQRIRGISDPNVRARVERATGVTYSAPSITSYPVSGPSGTSNVPSWLNTRNLPGLG